MRAHRLCHRLWYRNAWSEQGAGLSVCGGSLSAQVLTLKRRVDEMKTTNTRIKVTFLLVSIILVLTTLEVASIFGVRLLADSQPWIIWEQKDWAPKIPPQQYLSDRHPTLGWPSVSRLKGDEFDPDGSRKNTFFDVNQSPCVSTYGDSFTWSAEVSFEDAWPNKLSQLLGCRVTNFGIGGYGVGQAVLRYEENIQDRAPISILTIVPYNAYRNLNQLRSLLTGSVDPYSLKPRYILEEGALKLVPLLDLTEKELVTLSVKPSEVLTHEFFLPGSEYGPISVGFPYSRFWWDLLLNKAFMERLKSRITKEPHWSSFFQPGHPSQSLELMVELASKFARDAKLRQQSHLVALLPDKRSVDYFKATGSWEYQPLIDALKNMNISTTNLGVTYLQRLGKRSFCSVLKQPRNCSGHFNEEGYDILAHVVKDTLVTERLLDSRSKTLASAILPEE